MAFAALYGFLHVNPKRLSLEGCGVWRAPGGLAEFIKANFPLRAGEIVFGEVTAERKLHSVTSLAIENQGGAGGDQLDRKRKGEADAPDVEAITDALDVAFIDCSPPRRGNGAPKIDRRRRRRRGPQDQPVS
jgi:hypothetical protein